MSENADKKGGLRCHICTGCGLCPGITPKGSGSGRLHILAEETGSEAERKKMCRFGIEVQRKEALPEENNFRLVAVDIGTTTVAMLLYDQNGQVADRYVEVNPQAVYGADVLSRIRAASVAWKEAGIRGEQDAAGNTQSDGKSAAMEMQSMIRKVLEKGFMRFQGKLAQGEKMQAVIAANTTMNYLLMGWNPEELGRAPFEATHLTMEQAEIAGVSCFLLPGMSAFVGSDITAGIYGAGMSEKEEVVLLIDLGTNGEIVLGNCHRRIACATAAGPAFEGGVNKGIWGADMISLLATLRRKGIVDASGLLAEPYFETGIRIGNVLVTKEAVRAVQLAKGAVAAGIEILLDRYGITASGVDRVILAGGFGYYLKPEDAAEIGLLPEALVKKTVSGGNMALAGASRVGRELLAEGMLQAKAGATETEGRVEGRLESLTATTQVLNLAEQPEFEKSYIRKLNLE